MTTPGPLSLVCLVAFLCSEGFSFSCSNISHCHWKAAQMFDPGALNSPQLLPIRLHAGQEPCSCFQSNHLLWPGQLSLQPTRNPGAQRRQASGCSGQRTVHSYRLLACPQTMQPVVEETPPSTLPHSSASAKAFAHSDVSSHVRPCVQLSRHREFSYSLSNQPGTLASTAPTRVSGWP